MFVFIIQIIFLYLFMCVYTYIHIHFSFFQTIHLSTTVGSTAKQQLPLKNAGNIGVHLKVKVGWLLHLEIMYFVPLMLYLEKIVKP